MDGSGNNALGESALLNNITANANTALGDVALANNDSTGAGLGTANTAVGAEGLFHNTDGDSNTAVGHFALGNNVNGSFNTAVGRDALSNSTGGNNTALGHGAGSAVLTANNVIAIGSPGANVSNTCFIGNIAGVAVTGDGVVVAANGQLGVAPAGSPLSANELLKQQRVVQELKATTEKQAAVIALQEGQIKALTAGLQKVSAQLEASKPAPQVVNNP